MVVDRENQKPKSLLHADSGQSVLEFLLVLPVLFTVVMLIIRVNTAIQMSIVDQKYARAQTLYLSANSPEYPLRAGVVADLANHGMNQLVVGISEDHPSDANGGEGKENAASTYYIGRKPGGMGENSEPGDDISKRVTIRVRNTVTLCLPMIAIDGKPAIEFISANGGMRVKYNYKDDPKAWQFCSTKGWEQRG